MGTHLTHQILMGSKQLGPKKQYHNADVQAAKKVLNTLVTKRKYNRTPLIDSTVKLTKEVFEP